MKNYYITVGDDDRSLSSSDDIVLLREDSGVAFITFQMPAMIGGQAVNSYNWFINFRLSDGTTHRDPLSVSEADEMWTAEYIVDHHFTSCPGSVVLTLEAFSDAAEWHSLEATATIVDTLQTKAIPDKIKCTVSMVNHSIAGTIAYVQHNTNPEIQIYISDFTPPEGAVAGYCVEYTDGVGFIGAADLHSSIVTIKPARNAFSQAGSCKLQVKITKDSEVLCSWVFAVSVTENLFEHVMEEPTDTNITTQTIVALQAFLPCDVVAMYDETVTFVAPPGAKTYRWCSKVGNGYWFNLGENTIPAQIMTGVNQQVLTVALCDSLRMLCQYRCEMTLHDGSTVNTRAAKVGIPYSSLGDN